jgi:hypothetical protein
MALGGFREVQQFGWGMNDFLRGAFECALGITGKGSAVCAMIFRQPNMGHTGTTKLKDSAFLPGSLSAK